MKACKFISMKQSNKIKMEKIKVIVFGTLPLATKICELLLEHPKIDLYAVVLGKSNPVNINIFDNTKCLKDFTLEKDKKYFN